ncbi:beta-carotene 15,15'-monooxygenase [Cutibacterium equinum]|uniref:Beta-carotene 15,15'-monooxygenase n=1 Tax=Cutibacterium equinum TaxID=3016342 RepID=A0ABY7R0B6_9ACTN|nr:beta-carotene 15,15'-monooxygenase [Cutibacterium equinum]WCC80189.1 beta-carotene 15,15'-monooxygenase [Cutibacterium equinum]
MTAPTFRAAHDICDASSLDALGWGFSLKGYRVMRMLVVFLAFSLAFAVAIVGFDWLVGRLAHGGAIVAVALPLVIGVYILILHAFRETLTSRRIRLANHPCAEFFRALDISRFDVVVAEMLERLMMTTAVVAGLSWGTGLRASLSGIPPAAVGALVVIPVTTASGMVATTSWAAAKLKDSHRPSQMVAACSGAASGIVLALIVRWVADVGLQHLPAVQQPTWTWIAVGVAVVTIATGVAAATGLVSLTSAPFLVANRVSEDKATVRLRRLKGISPWLRVAMSDLTPVPVAAALARMVFLVWGIGAFAVAISSMVPGATSVNLPTRIVNQLSAILLLILGLVVSDLLSVRIGPAALAPRWRVAWELGANPTTLAIAPLAVAVLCGLFVVAPAAVATRALGGNAYIPLLVVWASIACAWVAAAVVASDAALPDGTVPASTSVALLSVVASTAMMAVILMAALHGVGWIGFMSTLVLLGGATWLTRQRVLALPSRPLA